MLWAERRAVVAMWSWAAAVAERVKASARAVAEGVGVVVADGAGGDDGGGGAAGDAMVRAGVVWEMRWDVMRGKCTMRWKRQF